MTLLLPQDKILTVKAQPAKVASSSTYRGVMRLLCLRNFASMALPLARLHSHPLQYWLKENHKTSADLFKGLKQDPEASQVLHWWHTFKLQPKSICRPLRGGSDNRYLQGWVWHAKMSKNIYINILELVTIWMTYQRFKELMRGKTISFQLDNTTAVAYLLKEGGTHCKTLNGLARKICSSVVRMG